MKWQFPNQKNENFVDFIYSTRKVLEELVFFIPKFEDLVSPFEIYDAKKAAKTILKAIEKKQKIYIHGDFDVDGISATSIMWNYLYKDLGANVLPHIPNRFTDGYGLNEETIKNIIADGGNLIISVDCGVKDIELVNKYADQIDFIITDHHSIRSGEEDIEGSKKVKDFLISSRAKAVVHPKLGKTELAEYCGTVVSWKVCAAVNELSEKKTDMSKYLDLAALGTVCDIMPLTGENRTIVKLGLEQFKLTINMGLKSLLNIADQSLYSVTEYTLGFVIGPRLNASGRLESALDAVRLLTTTSPEFAKQLSIKLNNLNLQRQNLTKEYLAIAEQDLITQGLEKKIFFVYGKQWPEGIVGLISGKLTEKYNRPTIVGSLLEDGNIKASARSIEGFHISNVLKDAEGHLIRYGGHAQAAGLTLSETKVTEFRELLSSIADKLIKEEQLEKSISIDAVAEVEDISLENIKKLLALSPFGNSNPMPVICIKNIDVSGFKTMGKDNTHVKISLPDHSIDLIAFNMADKFNKLDSPIQDLIGNLEINTWKNKQTATFRIIDLKQSK